MAALQKKPIYQAEELFAKQVIAEAKKILTRKHKNASKELYRSIRFDIVDGGIVFNYAQQGLFIEEGRRKGAKMPPLQAIEKWVKQKGISQFRDKKGRYLSSKTQAYLIARSIKAKGIKPLAWFSDPLERALRKFPDILREAIVQVMEKQIEDLQKA